MKLRRELIKRLPQQRLYQLSVPIIGLTGGIATGKTTVSNLLNQKGLAVINADSLVKEIYSWPETIQFVQDHFPHAIAEEKILFPILRQTVFNNLAAKDLIEKFIYQRLPLAFQSAFERLSSPAFVIYDVPLLFEKGLDQLVDTTTLVYAPRSVQKERLIKRDQISSALAENILDQQMDIETKKTKAEFIIDNTKTDTELLKEVDSFLQKVIE